MVVEVLSDVVLQFWISMKQKMYVTSTGIRFTKIEDSTKKGKN